MKKICFLIGNLNLFGGTERVTSIIANNLADRGYDITIASIVNGDKPFFELNKNVKYKSLSFCNTKKLVFKLPLIVRNLRNLLKEESIDTLIVVDTISVMFSLPAIVGLNVKHIGWEHFNFKSNLGNKKRWMIRRIAARYCDIIITLTERDRGFWLDSTMTHSKVVAISNPCPYPIQDNKYSNNENCIVLAVGRLTYVKGFDMLLKAWKDVVKEKPNWKLQIVGDGEESSNLRNFIHNEKLSNSVEMVGSVSTVEDYYENADIFCLSSRFEGFPMVLLETLSFGLPVVSFDCATGPEEILKDTNSVLVAQNDIAMLSKELISLMDNREKRNLISQKSKEKAKQYHPMEIISKWEELLEKY